MFRVWIRSITGMSSRARAFQYEWGLEALFELVGYLYPCQYCTLTDQKAKVDKSEGDYHGLLRGAGEAAATSRCS